MKFSITTGGFYSPAIHNSIPSDAIEISHDVYLALLDGRARGQEIAVDENGKLKLLPLPDESQQQLIEMFSRSVQNKLDITASQWGYDSISNAVTYAEEPAVPRFQAEGQAFRAWRSACWEYCYRQLNLVISEQREMPSVEQLISELPALELAHG